jgi:hypothetical protein
VKMTYAKSQFEMPDGKYLAKFTGVTMREDKPGESPRLGQDGKPLPPAMTWDFEIVEGDQAGKKADKLTGRIPTPRSGCGKMLSAVTDTILKDGVEVDLDTYVGKLYRITVMENRVQDAPPPVRVYDQSQAAPSAGGSSPPPPRRGAAAPADPEFYVDATGFDGAKLYKASEIQKYVETTGGVDLANLFVAKPGSNDWHAVTVTIPGSDKWLPF